MPTAFTINENEPILVEFGPGRGLQQVSRSPEDLAAKSAEVLNKAMSTIHNTAQRVMATIREIDISDRPAQVEVEFGLTLDADAGALIAHVGAEASFTVKLIWKASPPAQPQTGPDVGEDD